MMTGTRSANVWELQQRNSQSKSFEPGRAGVSEEQTAGSDDSVSKSRRKVQMRSKEMKADPVGPQA